MKNKFFLLIIFFQLLLFNKIVSQNITISDLELFVSKNNWAEVNQSLMKKGWEYSDSKKGELNNYSMISWSLNRDQYSNAATGWIYLYAFEQIPSKINYSFASKNIYLRLHESLNTKGYHLINSDIKENNIVTVYKNNKYILKINSETVQSKDDYGYNETSQISYSVILIKIGGKFDNFNGERTVYWENSNQVKIIYNLKDEKLEGLYRSFYKNGKIEKEGNFTEGKANGKFVEYEEDGEVKYTYNMVDDKLNGLLTIYEDNKISVVKEYIMGVQNGMYEELTYSENFVKSKLKGNYVNDEKQGKWTNIEYKSSDTSEKSVLSTEYYENGLRNGLCMYKKEDTIKYFTFVNDIKNGPFEILVLNQKYIKGTYQNGKKQGKLTKYFIKGKLKGEVFMVTDYYRGFEEGIRNIYTFLPERDVYKGMLDILPKYLKEYSPILETVTMGSNKENGIYTLKDSTGTTVIYGAYSSGEKAGYWWVYDGKKKTYLVFDAEGNVKSKHYDN